ncbi:MAG: AAA family ATPase, partial [Planctomycetales bacterium]|nr:AAA family ATPase [Planctomycetales bacterium]
MTQVDLKELINKLNSTGRRTLEAAAGLCMSRTNYNVEIEHWLAKLLEQSNADLHAVFKHFDVDMSRLIADLTRCLDRFKTGNSRPPALSPDLIALAKTAWLLASVDFNAGAVRSGHLLCALLADDSLRHIAKGVSPELEKVSLEKLRQQLGTITQASDENEEVAVAPVGSGAGKPRPATGPTKTPALDQYTIDLTARARAGEIDPVLGRDVEIRQIIDILLRRRQNNPILTGEAGVGKTAVVEGFALRLAAGDVPDPLKNVILRTLDLGLLQAGAGVKGEFENRLKSVISEVKSSPIPIILFIDEAHTLIGAGGAAGQNDAANLLKPALARGELRTIAATTWAEYKRYFEKDAAMARRFQLVKVEEPTEDSAVQMMRGLADTLEHHHRVRILNEAVVDAVKLSSRYISGRQLPDKAVSLLDTTCARIALSQSSRPPAIEDVQRRIEQLHVALGILQRESTAGISHDEAIAEMQRKLADAEAEQVALATRWDSEQAMVRRINELRQQLETGQVTPTVEPTATPAAETPSPDQANTDAPAAAPAVAQP